MPVVLAILAGLFLLSSPSSLARLFVVNESLPCLGSVLAAFFEVVLVGFLTVALLVFGDGEGAGVVVA